MNTLTKNNVKFADLFNNKVRTHLIREDKRRSRIEYLRMLCHRFASAIPPYQTR
jgi:hypothetical protein